MAIRFDTIEKNGITGIAPVIISASRATDIPALYAEWLKNRIKAGYSVWKNPFNNKTQRVFFDNARVFVFWTKNPEPLIKSGVLELLDEKGIGYYFQYSLNDYDTENFEPGLPDLTERIRTFQVLSEKIGRQKVIWRFDPLILSDYISADDLCSRVSKIADKIAGYTEKLIISFVDVINYKKVCNRVENLNIREFNKEEVYSFCDMLSLKNETKRWNMNIASCAEQYDLSQYSILKNSCIDGNLIYRLFKHDMKLQQFLGTDKQMVVTDVNAALKDPGQRKECGCIKSKDIGGYNTCVHFCSYCYANSSPELVQKNYDKHDENGESL